MKLTQNRVGSLALSPGERDKIFWDEELVGSASVFREGGSRKWIVQYRWNGGQRQFTIGHASVHTLDEARKRARKVLVGVDDGVDPSAEKAERAGGSGAGGSGDV